MACCGARKNKKQFFIQSSKYRVRLNIKNCFSLNRNTFIQCEKSSL